MTTTPPLPSHPPLTAQALYRCSIHHLQAALSEVVSRLSAPDTPRWYLSMPTPYAATVWRPGHTGEPHGSCELSLYLCEVPPHVHLWSVVSRPPAALLFGALMARLDEHLGQEKWQPLQGLRLPRPIEGRPRGRPGQDPG